MSGPVSAALEADVRTWVRRHGIVLWLDLDASYTGFVDALIAARAEGALPYEVRAYRESHLELMLGLEALTGGADKRPLLVHRTSSRSRRRAGPSASSTWTICGERR